jgi:hypothetical protein
MRSACMATKTISLKTEAYQRLRSVRRYSDESFSDIVLRATWPDETVTAGELLDRLRSTPHSGNPFHVAGVAQWAATAGSASWS